MTRQRSADEIEAHIRIVDGLLLSEPNYWFALRNLESMSGLTRHQVRHALARLRRCGRVKIKGTKSLARYRST